MPSDHCAWTQLFGFLLVAIPLPLWENLSNDLFDAETGVDATGKPLRW